LGGHSGPWITSLESRAEWRADEGFRIHDPPTVSTGTHMLRCRSVVRDIAVNDIRDATDCLCDVALRTPRQQVVTRLRPAA
jgi:hypothetical protein